MVVYESTEKTSWVNILDNCACLDKKKLAKLALLFTFQVRNITLVSDNGIIRPGLFYKALTVWIDRDVLGYAFSQVKVSLTS